MYYISLISTFKMLTLNEMKKVTVFKIASGDVVVVYVVFTIYVRWCWHFCRFKVSIEAKRWRYSARIPLISLQSPSHHHFEFMKPIFKIVYIIRRFLHWIIFFTQLWKWGGSSFWFKSNSKIAFTCFKNFLKKHRIFSWIYIFTQNQTINGKLS